MTRSFPLLLSPPTIAKCKCAEAKRVCAAADGPHSPDVGSFVDNTNACEVVYCAAANILGSQTCRSHGLIYPAICLQITLQGAQQV